MPLEFIVAGVTKLERLTETGAKWINIPFVFRFEPGAIPELSEIATQAKQVATQFLQLLKDTAPSRVDEYGKIGNVVFESAGYSTTGEPPAPLETPIVEP